MRGRNDGERQRAVTEAHRNDVRRSHQLLRCDGWTLEYTLIHLISGQKSPAARVKERIAVTWSSGESAVHFRSIPNILFSRVRHQKKP